MNRTWHVDTKGKRVIGTDHPTVKAHLMAKGYKIAPASYARHLTMTPGTHPDARGYTYSIQNGNWTS